MKPIQVMRYIAVSGVSNQPGSDPYVGNVTSLLHFDGNNGDTVVIDSKGRAWSRVGNAVISNLKSMFGPTSSYFDGNADSWTTGNSNGSLIAFQTPYTIECFVYVEGDGYTGYGSGIYGQCYAGPFGEQGLSIKVDGSVSIYRSSGVNGGDDQSVNLTAGTCPTNQWVHIAETFDGATIRIFINGVLKSSISSTRGWNVTTSPFMVGNVLVSPYPQYRRNMQGYIDEFRITKGIARYITDFTPPAAPFPPP